LTHPVERYLAELRDIHLSRAGVPETSGYPALKALLDEIGKGLSPRVRCIIHPPDKGAGLPDGGLYSSDQFPRREHVPKEGQLPSGGVLEVKGPGEVLAGKITSEQVLRYVARYGQVLVTNYREFALMVRTPRESAKRVDGFTLAGTEEEFRGLLAQPRTAANERGDRLVEFLTRVLRNRAILTDPADVAWFLASYARDAADIIAHRDIPTLGTIRKALQEALGITFQGEAGDHFFRSTLVQTLFYGIFSGWVLWSRSSPSRDPEAVFDWKDAAWYLKVPMIRALFQQIAQPGPVDELGLKPVLDRTGDVLNRVDRAAFFQRFQEEDAVQYFYEPFLQAFDPELRKELGVWYTPREVVKYMVARVDAALRDELGLPRGLADPNVYVLDPCCGTGAYLVEVLKTIARTLSTEGGDALVAHDLRQAAQERVFGFEILPAPFVVSHLQLGLLLHKLGAPFGEGPADRAGVYLTNALTGWDRRPDAHLPFPELERERDLAEDVKLAKPVLVILGNPPYNGFAGVTESEEERALTNAYKTTVRAPKPQGQGLNDLYVRFFRMAERKIVEHTGRGIVCFISNYSWLDGLSFTGMRERYLDQFDRIWIDNLHGDRIISEYAPDGATSETVFAVQGSSAGIKIGTAITLLSRFRDDTGGAEVLYRDWEQARADERRHALLDSITKADIGVGYSRLSPVMELGLPFKPLQLEQRYLSWPTLPELFPVSFPGVKTSRDDLLVDIDRDRLITRMRQYFDPRVSNEDMKRTCPAAMRTTNRFQAEKTRQDLLQKGFVDRQVLPYLYRPFDVRWLYWESETKLLDEKRTEYVGHVSRGNSWLIAQQRPRRDWDPPQVTEHVGCLDVLDRSAAYFPQRTNVGLVFGVDETNISGLGKEYAARVSGSPGSLWDHALAILHAPLYRNDNIGALSQDWPRIPLPNTPERLLESANLGRRMAELLDPQVRVEGVTAGTIRPDLVSLGPLSSSDGTYLNPSTGDLALTTGWGHAGKGGVTMPGRGRLIKRPDDALDIYLNDRAYWANVPAAVWDYTLGGYQVIKKWLSYREKALLGRDLTPEEARYVTEMVRRIAAILALGPVLDRNYERVKSDPYAWPEQEA